MADVGQRTVAFSSSPTLLALLVVKLVIDAGNGLLLLLPIRRIRLHRHLPGRDGIRSRTLLVIEFVVRVDGRETLFDGIGDGHVIREFVTVGHLQRVPLPWWGKPCLSQPARGTAQPMSATTATRSVLVWHVHGSWMESFVRGEHRYLLPVNSARDADGRGLCGRKWSQAQEVPVADLRDEDVDLVVLQRPNELELATQWLGRRPGADVPAVYLEHNTPRPFAADSVHPMAGRTDIPVVHVTDFNRLMWENGRAETRVITHGIPDPREMYTGELPAAATMINEPIRRWRTVGTDLLAELGTDHPIDVWGIGTLDLNDPRHRTGKVRGKGDVPTARLMRQVARRRVYLHTARWTSLGMSLVEAMYLGMPVVSVASTMAPLVVPGEAGVVSADVNTLAYALAGFITDFSAATLAGKAAREFAMAHFSLDRFLAEWDSLIQERCV
ncbi:MAG: hypothetical protein JWR37_1809 [Mycobacterium sp.]|nr:hypothetical protein [Mycobacterium sp.]